ncbi:hypothetical protein [Chitinophaga japonensis]|uniref:Uncharacterized protein n=1 Tax=Chitinophaga japonensis TaxID=104662 RepID=A0A562SZY2_CHIJA|nr:hypothetical protein [Chitinophaga japonensis]TWI86821.1 hypothetical protein LX66_4085 [Chitinophaga japonensis]
MAHDHEDTPRPAPGGGNASNPAPGQENEPGKGMFDEKAEKYLKESANIEDMPDPEEDREAEERLKKEKDEDKNKDS